VLEYTENYGRILDEVVEWHNKCFESKYFCTPPNTNSFDFNTLWSELKYKNKFLCYDN